MRLSTAFVAFLFMFSFPLLATAQQNIIETPCLDSEGQSPTSLEQRVGCLEKQIADLKDLQELLLNTQLELSKRLQETAEQFEIIVHGPGKKVERFPATIMAVVHAYWADGNRVVIHNCVPPLEKRSGFTLIGGVLGDEVRITGSNASQYGNSMRGCAPAPFCDSAGEFCTARSRSQACYVNTVWLDWYKQDRQKKGLPIDWNEVCSG